MAGGKKKGNKLKRKTPVAEAMGMLLLPKVEDILGLEDLVRAGDVDGVHDMRIATKRLREAAKLFRPAFGKRRMAAHMAHLDQLNDALGVARELDVLGLQVQELAGKDARLAGGLAPLSAKLAADREAAGTRLEATLNEALPHLSQDFVELLEDRPKKRKDVWGMRFGVLGCRSVSERVEAAFELERAARVPEAVADFHLMRIAVKKVKYALELFLGVLGKPAQKLYQPISALQERMGAVHDCDVLLRVLGAAKGETISAATANRALNLVAADRLRQHSETMALLDRMLEKQVRERLLKACGGTAGDRD